jgi:hypothetical protein
MAVWSARCNCALEVQNASFSPTMQAVSKAAQEYEQFYVPEMEARKKEKSDVEARRQKVRRAHSAHWT